MGADGSLLVIERVTEIAEPLGEYAGLRLEVVGPMLVAARESLLLVEDFEDDRPRVTTELVREPRGDHRIEALREVVEPLLDRQIRLEWHQKMTPPCVPGSMPSSNRRASSSADPFRPSGAGAAQGHRAAARRRRSAGSRRPRRGGRSWFKRLRMLRAFVEDVGESDVAAAIRGFVRWTRLDLMGQQGGEPERRR
jgi:hypothetical protein